MPQVSQGGRSLDAPCVDPLDRGTGEGTAQVQLQLPTHFIPSSPLPYPTHTSFFLSEFANHNPPTLCKPSLWLHTAAPTHLGNPPVTYAVAYQTRGSLFTLTRHPIRVSRSWGPCSAPSSTCALRLIIAQGPAAAHGPAPVPPSSLFLPHSL